MQALADSARARPLPHGARMLQVWGGSSAVVSGMCMREGTHLDCVVQEAHDTSDD